MITNLINFYDKRWLLESGFKTILMNTFADAVVNSTYQQGLLKWFQLFTYNYEQALTSHTLIQQVSLYSILCILLAQL